MIKIELSFYSKHIFLVNIMIIIRKVTFRFWQCAWHVEFLIKHVFTDVFFNLERCLLSKHNLNANSWSLFGISFIFLIFDYWTTSLAYAIFEPPLYYILIIFFVLKVYSIFLLKCRYLLFNHKDFSIFLTPLT